MAGGHGSLDEMRAFSVRGKKKKLKHMMELYLVNDFDAVEDMKEYEAAEAGGQDMGAWKSKVKKRGQKEIAAMLTRDP